MIYIGIDPGAGGGIAAIGPPGWLKTIPMPATERDIVDFLDLLMSSLPVAGPEDAHAVIEHVWSIPGQGGAFKFGVSVGALRMALTAAGIPFDPILPRIWQKALGVVYPKGSTDTQKKNITKRRAQQLFPGLINITHAVADALLLAEYCRRLHRQQVDAGERRGHSAPILPGEHKAGHSMVSASASNHVTREVTHGKAESLTRTEGLFKGTGGEQTISITDKLKACIIRPKAEQGSRRARAAQRPDPPRTRAGAGRAARDGKHGRR